MPKLRRESLPKFLEEPYVEGQSAQPLFRHGQTPLDEKTHAHIAELVCTTPAEGITYWSFKTLAEQVSQNIKA
jgi:hypothetical protein